MSGRTVALAPGARLLFDGEVVEVLALEGTRVSLRVVRTDGMQTVGLTRLVSAARGAVEPVGEDAAVGVALAGFDGEAARAGAAAGRARAGSADRVPQRPG